MGKKRVTPSCQQLIDSFPEPFVIIDRDYTIVSANNRYARHYGAEPASIAGRRCYEVSHHLPSPCSRHGEHCPLEEMFRTGETTQVMHLHYDADGQEERVQITATPLFGDDGELQFMGESITPLQGAQANVPIVGHSESMQLVLQQLQRVAPTRTSVLLVGESGTGKECLAQYLHACSGRQQKPFVVVDCAAMAGSDDIDQELFGVEADAGSGRPALPGLFERADGGSLFIDEVGELPLSSQTRLLRALESREIKRVGGSHYRKVDVRVIVASSHDLKAMVAEGSLRKDLYYRLSAFPVQVPPLRERGGDLLELAEHFLDDMQGQEGPRLEMDEAFRRALMAHDYPGNVRELRNLIERAVIYAAGDPLSPAHLVFDHDLFGDSVQPATPADATPLAGTERGRLISRRGTAASDDEVLRVLSDCNGHRAEAARRLGVSERTLYRHLKRLRSQGDKQGLVQRP